MTAISNNNTALIGSIQKFSIEDGPGIRSTVFLKGCPLNCKWCHNPELISFQQELIQSPNNCIGCGNCITVCPQGAIRMDRDKGIVIDRDKCDVCLKCADGCFARALRPVATPMTVDEVLDVVLQDKGFYDNTGGGITVSGGEVLGHAEFAAQLIDAAAEHDVNSCLDTCGYGDPDTLMDLSLRPSVTDILYDVKSIDDEVHHEYTRARNKLILRNLKMLSLDPRTTDKLTVRMPLIKDINDSDSFMQRSGRFFRDIGVRRVTLLPYHALGIGKKRNIGGTQEEFQQPDDERVDQIERYFRDEIHLEVEIQGRV